MTDTLALEKLYGDVSALFVADKSAIPNLFGWRERTKLMQNGPGPGNKVVWVPGNEPGNGDAGKHNPPSKVPGFNPRSLATLNEVFTVYVSAFDADQPENELAQYKACRLVYDAWFRAVYLAAYGTFEILTLNWDRTKTERQHGAMLIAVCTVQAMIPDAAYGVAPTSTAAKVTTTVLDQTDPTVKVQAS